MDKNIITMPQVKAVREAAQHTIDHVYNDYLGTMKPPKITDGIVRAILGAAIEAGIVEAKKE